MYYQLGLGKLVHCQEYVTSTCSNTLLEVEGEHN